jgi:hypothetical protein
MINSSRFQIRCAAQKCREYIQNDASMAPTCVVVKDIVFLTTHPYIAFLANPSKYNIHGISIDIQWFKCWKPLNSKQMPDSICCGGAGHSPSSPARRKSHWNSPFSAILREPLVLFNFLWIIRDDFKSRVVHECDENIFKMMRQWHHRRHRFYATKC